MENNKTKFDMDVLMGVNNYVKKEIVEVFNGIFEYNKDYINNRLILDDSKDGVLRIFMSKGCSLNTLRLVKKLRMLALSEDI